jgi:hypothetical protein
MGVVASSWRYFSTQSIIHHSAPQQIARRHNTSSPRPSESTSGGRGPIPTFLYCACALDSSLSFLSSCFASTRTDTTYIPCGHGFDPGEVCQRPHHETPRLQQDPGSGCLATNPRHSAAADLGLCYADTSPPGGRRLRRAPPQHHTGAGFGMRVQNDLRCV